jgi:glycosyltransferase involved in cell wall biosynthesis
MAMKTAHRLTVVMTHPVQYYSPWFRHIASNCPEIQLTVVYAVQPSPAQQGVGFGMPFSWDTPLTEGYKCSIVRSTRPGESVHSDDFWGVDVPEIGEAIRNSQPDVVLIVGWYSVTLLRALWACQRLRIPVLYRGDTHVANAPSGWKKPFWRMKTRLLLKRFDGYLSVGKRTREYFRHFGVPASRIYHTPHCVDNEFFANAAEPHQDAESRAKVRLEFGLAPDTSLVVFVGKLEAKKRPLDLIRAMSRLGPDASLLVVGTGPLESVCHQEAKRLGVSVSWAGFLNQTHLGRVYAAADCLVLPSDWGETWGLVVNEALSTGLPCVVSDRVGCAPDLIRPGVTGEVFPMGDVQALANGIKSIVETKKSGHAFTDACRLRIEGYSYKAATTGLIAGCESVVQLRKKSASRQQGDRPRVIACCGAMFFVSGLERMTFEVLRVLREHGAAVHCVVNTSANWETLEETHPIAALAEQIGATWSTGYYWYRLDRHTRNLIKLAQIAWDIAMTSVGLLRDSLAFRPTHILLPDFLTVLRNGIALSVFRLMGIRVILHVHNPPALTAFYRRIWRLGVSPLVDKFVCCSQHVKEQLMTIGISETKASVIHNTVPQRRSAVAKGASRNDEKLIFVGQIIPEKGLDLLLEAMALLVERGRKVSLDVVGDMNGWAPPPISTYRETLRARANDSVLAGRVQFLGWRDDVPTLLAHAAIHCIPSRPTMFEGFPLVNLEAKMAAIPSVAFNTGPFSELIDHPNDGWLCSEISANELARGIDYFITDGGRLQAARSAARCSANKFSPERFANSWWTLFQQSTTV